MSRQQPVEGAITISAERADSPDAMALIAELDEHLVPFYPPESRHGFSVEKLIAEGVAFFVLRVASVPAACGGVKLFGDEYAEVKRMFVRPLFRGRGLARRVLVQIEQYALAQGQRILRLETGIHQHAAIRLYEGMGFRRIPPFGTYSADPASLCYEKHISADVG